MRVSLAVILAAVLASAVTVHSIILNSPARTEAATLQSSVEGRMLGKLSLGLRSTAASFLWLRVDEYMHRGDPVKWVVREGDEVVDEHLMGVTWRSNPDAVTLLKFVTVLDPSFTAAQSALGEHLTRDRGLFDEGLRHLQQAILYNRNHPKLYALYGKIGEICFDTKLYPQARNYLLEAVELYPRVQDERLIGTDLIEDNFDRMRLRGYLSYLASAYFELRDWPNTYRWWTRHGAFNQDNHISRWMNTWVQNPDAEFDPEKYAAVPTLPRTETERHLAPNKSGIEVAEHQTLWLEPDWPAEFYYKLYLLAVVNLVLLLGIGFKKFW